MVRVEFEAPGIYIYLYVLFLSRLFDLDVIGMLSKSKVYSKQCILLPVKSVVGVTHVLLRAVSSVVPTIVGRLYDLLDFHSCLLFLVNALF
ncbi:unnamed protein product [Acanthoscelides obtectus]|uniref:Uncharacterized protein n=1 Tax=Acanthoscelides obtectus TaxID=200917 RepID=A0A9P0KLR4_ACAOB|nr:unnamed protein product [Acanthoscelides obtectus]CAK1655821.1 hypothetical protein AOBTE_LOCUS19364 [Acanthoscelides obtectus]